MAKNCCGQDSCSCLIQAGDGVTVVGSGAPTDPYLISLDTAAFSPTLRVQDTATVNLTVFGSGTSEDPYILRADSTLGIADLTDVAQITPNAGDVLGWDATTQLWKPGAPPANPAGSVNVSQGIGGTGAAATPLKLNTSGVWGTAPLTGADSTIGLQVYIDSAGNVRTQLPDWSTITGKPTTFPPSAHTHVAADITDPQNLKVGGVNAANSDTATGGNIFRVAHTEDVSWANGTIWFQY